MKTETPPPFSATNLIGSTWPCSHCQGKFTIESETDVDLTFGSEEQWLDGRYPVIRSVAWARWICPSCGNRNRATRELPGPSDPIQTLLGYAVITSIIAAFIAHGCSTIP